MVLFYRVAKRDHVLPFQVILQENKEGRCCQRCKPAQPCFLSNRLMNESLPEEWFYLGTKDYLIKENSVIPEASVNKLLLEERSKA